MVEVDVHLSSHSKEEQAWAVDKWLRIISTSYNVIKNSTSTKELKGTKE